MICIATLIHPSLASPEGRVLRRQAARGIVVRGNEILLLFTERYNDFSLPGGGIDEGEDVRAALVRELEEETGARDVQVLHYEGWLDELRPWRRGDHDVLHMTSHFFRCNVAPTLQETKMEGYERANGMRPVWVNLDDALTHNRAVLQRQETTMGQSIQRETFMLARIRGQWDGVGWRS